ncbi:MAG: hypothetical protein AB7W16_00275 [Candidatus Obscuribacterales bacterium]
MLPFKIDSETTSRARSAADSLKARLEARLVGRKTSGWSCNCGACGAGDSVVVGVSVPSMARIARFLFWSCRLEDGAGKTWSHGLDQYIPLSELHVMFREAFQGIEVRTDHPAARFLRGEPARTQSRPFTRSGIYVRVEEGRPVLLKPRLDENSPWLTAELRIDSGIARYVEKGPLHTLTVDPSSVGQGPGEYYDLADAGGIYYVDTVDHLIPIARLNQSRKGSTIFELDRDVIPFFN